MRYLDLTLPTLEENLALDEALLLDAEANSGTEVLRLWEWSRPAVVMGSACRLSEDVHEVACRADAVPILRRASGGGTVLLGRGCLLYSMVLSFARSPDLVGVRGSYCYILGTVRHALHGLLTEITCAGTSDLAASGRKFSGNSQQRKRRYLLHHGTILYAFAVAEVGRYLALPIRRPDYRADRDHDAFLTNLPATSAEIKQRLRSTWQASEELREWPQDQVRELARDKYASQRWIRRR
jgi:lipoate-protein ligase A